MILKTLFEQMDKLEDLLPGIEDYLCTVLAKESLTPEAEEQRLYFVERLDIIKLPPSVPPRPQSLGLKLHPLTDGALPDQNLTKRNAAAELEDFAAYQRELSRAQVVKGNKSPQGSSEEEVKVYDDIDSKDLSATDSHIEDEESMYEIPKLKRNLSDSGYEKALHRTSLSNICESPSSDTEIISHPAVPQPPPLPPRKERTSSNAASRTSIGSILEEKLGDLSEHSEQQFTVSSNEGKSDTKSEKSNDDLMEDYTGDEVDAVSVNSVDQDSDVKLPRVMKKKRHHHRVTHSFSAPFCDISNSFCDLADVMLSGELYYKSTLLSTKYLVALSTTSLVCYKFDKTESKPVLVIPLTGYRATFHKRHSRQSYEIQLCHDELEDHSFLSYFKEWAQTWCEYINCVADGRKVTGPQYSLVRNRRSMEPAYSSTYDLTKASSGIFGSSVSVCSYEGLEPETGKPKKRSNSGNRQRIGSIVSRASSILDNFRLLKKSGPHYEDQTHIPKDAKNDTVIAHNDAKDKANADDTSKTKGDSSTKLKNRSESMDKLRTKSDSNIKNRSDSKSKMDHIVKSKSESGVKSTSKTDNSVKQSSQTDIMKKLTLPEKRGTISGSSVSSDSEKGSVSEPLSPLTPESGVFEPSVIDTPTKVPKFVKHQGYLNIYSSFNKRKWGKRWCKVLENNFECYRNQTSTVCELDFLLQGCILRRAIEETKSELGLMLMENNREKITVEALTWTELGSWLRVLMKETLTPKVPEGLEGYMEDVNEYHAIVDDTIDADAVIHTQISSGCETTASKMALESTKPKSTFSRNSNRDSGNCSGESIDGRLEFVERTSVHPEFSDSSLPRTSAHRTGDLYTQVRKSSSENILARNEPENKRHSPHLKSEGKKHSSEEDSHSIDFEGAEDNLFRLEREKSIVDEVMSKFTSQISGGGFDDVDDNHEYEEFENVARPSNIPHTEREHIYVDIDSCKKEDTLIDTCNRRLSRDLTEIEVISPIKEKLELNSSDIPKQGNFLCSSFADDNQGHDSSASDERHFENTMTITADGGDLATSKAVNSDHTGAVAKKVGFCSPEKSSESAIAHANVDKENLQYGWSEQNSKSGRPEVCVEDLANDLGNLSLEDKDSTETDSKNLTNITETKDSNLINKGPVDSDMIEMDKNNEAFETGDKTMKASCDNDKQVPLEPELPNIIDEDARTRRSVAMREMAEMGGDLERALREMRTKLVQLKKERISIHDRMQLSSNNPPVHRYLEDEYNRLNREVDKVNEEIACLEELEKEKLDKEQSEEEKRDEKKKIFYDDVEEIDLKTIELGQ